MSLGVGLGVGLGRATRRGFTPADLGASLLANWDAEVTSSLTLSGSSVTTWTDTKAGIAPTQSTGGSKPIWGGASFNSRPGVTFDGIDDYLEIASVPFPDNCEIWALLDQTALATDGVTTRTIMQLGHITNATSYSIRRATAAGPSNCARAVGSANADSTADFSGKHVIRGIFTPTLVSVSQDGEAPTSVAVSNVLGTTRTRLGATTGTTPGSFLQAIVNQLLVTAPLDTTQASNLLTFLKARGGIP